MDHPLTLVNRHLQYQKVSLVATADSYYLHLAAEIDRNPLPFYWRKSARKRQWLGEAKAWCQSLEMQPEVISAVTFEASLIPPGAGKFLRERTDQAKIARYDVAVLVEVKDQEAMERIKASAGYQELRQHMEAIARKHHCFEATNVRRIGPVDHDRQGVFLFNYFFADHLDQNLAVWEYTAGWFEQETKLDNSTVLLPLHPKEANYTIVNHCRWDGFRDILPSLLFKRSFGRYVLDNFYANQTAAMPILYRLA